MVSRRLTPTGLVGQRIEQFYSQVANSLAEARTSDDLSLDMSSVGFIVPEGIIALVSAGRLWHRVTGKSVRLCGLTPPVHGYLDRMDVFATCGIWLKEESPLPAHQRFDRSGASENLLEVIPIAGTEDRNSLDVHAAVARAYAIVGAWFDADVDAINRLLTMLSEVTSNITHSLDRGFATIQHYRGGGGRGGRVSMAVGDLGIGIEASLRSKSSSHRAPPGLRLKTGSDYILHALKLGVTSRNTVAGTGLYRVRGLVEEWHGRLVIRSRRSVVQIQADSVSVADDLAEMPGTQVTITVRGPAKSLP
jgi:hypothetical protein